MDGGVAVTMFNRHKANPALAALPRHQRRQVLDAERRNRKAGSWGEWEIVTVPVGSAGRTWAAGFTKVHKNRVFAVMDRTLPCGTRHLMISSVSGDRPTWHEAQRIKDEIAGPESTAVEVYPPKAEIVDGADAYHLWVLTAPLPFSIFERRA